MLKQKLYIVVVISIGLMMSGCGLRTARQIRDLNQKVESLTQKVESQNQRIESLSDKVESLTRQVADKPVIVRADTSPPPKEESQNQKIESLIKQLGFVPANNPENNNEEAAQALAAIGKPALPAVIAALNDEYHIVRLNAAYTLGLIGEPTEVVVPALAKAIKDNSFWVRQRAANAFGMVRGAANEIVPILIEALDDESDEVRYAAASSLRKIGTSDAMKALEEFNQRNR